jgi:hypothetical protein
MFLNWLRRLIFVLTAIVVPETFLTAAQPQILIDDSLAGQLLIASPCLCASRSGPLGKRAAQRPLGIEAVQTRLVPNSRKMNVPTSTGGLEGGVDVRFGS